MSGPNPESLRCYTEDWRAWCAWCAANSVDPVYCTVDDLARCFQAWLAAGRSCRSIGRRKAAIGHFQRQAGDGRSVASDYAVRAVMRALRQGGRPARGKQGISRADLTRIIANCEADPKPLRGLRDRAVFVVGWYCVPKPSALAALRIADLSAGPRLERLPADARRMVLEWVQAARIVDGPLFRNLPLGGTVGDRLTRGSIGRMVKRRCGAIGKAKALFSVSSVRVGRVAHEIKRGTDVRDIMSLVRVHTVQAIVHRVGMAREP